MSLLTSNLRRLSWTTQGAEGRPPPTTMHPQVEPPPPPHTCNNNNTCNHASHPSSTHRALRRALSFLLPTPTMVTAERVKARESARGKAKAKVTTTTAPASVAVAATPMRGHPSTTLGLAPFPCGQGCALLHSRRVHRHSSMPCSLHQGTMGPSAELCSRPCQCPKYTTSRLHPPRGHPAWALGTNIHWPTPSAPWL
jgi:hypothetical protein